RHRRASSLRFSQIQIACTFRGVTSTSMATMLSTETTFANIAFTSRRPRSVFCGSASARSSESNRPAHFVDRRNAAIGIDDRLRLQAKSIQFREKLGCARKGRRKRAGRRREEHVRLKQNALLRQITDRQLLGMRHGADVVEHKRMF